MWTKRQIVDEAYAELALAGYEFDIQPEELDAALRRLDTMMAAWSVHLPLGYAMALDPLESSLDQDSGLQGYAVSAVYQALAVRIAASKGKQVPQSLKATAKADYDLMLSHIARDQTQEQRLRSGVPRGAGQKPHRLNSPFSPTPSASPLRDAENGSVLFGEVP